MKKNNWNYIKKDDDNFLNWFFGIFLAVIIIMGLFNSLLALGLMIPFSGLLGYELGQKNKNLYDQD